MSLHWKLCKIHPPDLATNEDEFDLRHYEPEAFDAMLVGSNLGPLTRFLDEADECWIAPWQSVARISADPRG